MDNFHQEQKLICLILPNSDELQARKYIVSAFDPEYMMSVLAERAQIAIQSRRYNVSRVEPDAHPEQQDLLHHNPSTQPPCTLDPTLTLKVGDEAITRRLRALPYWV